MLCESQISKQKQLSEFVEVEKDEKLELKQQA